MTPRETIVAELYKHFQGREFTIKDVAARVPHTINWVRKVLQSTEGITLSRQEPILVRGIEAAHGRQRGYYRYEPQGVVAVPSRRTLAEEIVREHFAGKEFTSADLSAKASITQKHALDIIQTMRGVQLVRTEASTCKGGGGSVRHYYTFKPVSTDKWVA